MGGKGEGGGQKSQKMGDVIYGRTLMYITITHIYLWKDREVYSRGHPASSASSLFEAK